MSIDQLDVVDAVGTDKVSGEVVLTIADHRDWSDVRQHLLALQEKINVYMGFIVSGHVFTEYPLAEGKKMRIDVVFRHAPLHDDATRFLTDAKSQIERFGYSLSYRVFDGTKAEPVDTDQRP